MPKIPNPFDKPKRKMGKKKTPSSPKDPKPKPPTKYYGYGHKPAPYGKKNLGAGVDTRPTERDSQIRKSYYGPPRTARDLELTKPRKPKARPMPKGPSRNLKPRRKG
jgi:hypothetical protein